MPTEYVNVNAFGAFNESTEHANRGKWFVIVNAKENGNIANDKYIVRAYATKGEAEEAALVASMSASHDDATMEPTEFHAASSIGNIGTSSGITKDIIKRPRDVDPPTPMPKAMKNEAEEAAGRAARLSSSDLRSQIKQAVDDAFQQNGMSVSPCWSEARKNKSAKADKKEKDQKKYQDLIEKAKRDGFLMHAKKMIKAKEDGFLMDGKSVMPYWSDAIKEKFSEALKKHGKQRGAKMPCGFFFAGNCRKGAKCQFAHVEG